MKVNNNSLKGLGVSQSIKVSGFFNVDAWYGPWESIDKVTEAIVALNLDENDDVFGVVTVAVWDDASQTSVTEYWNPDASTNFVKKSQEIDLDVLDERYVRAEDIEEDDQVEMATKEYVETQLSNKADKSDLENLASEEYIETVVNNIDHSMYVPRTLYNELYENFEKLVNKLKAYDDKFGYVSINGEPKWSKTVQFVGENEEALFDIVDEIYGIASNKESLNAILADDTVNIAVLKDDIEISSTIALNDGKTKTIMLNGNSIMNGHVGELNQWTANCDGVTVNNGTLTITGDGKIETLSKTGSPVYASSSNANITIENGYYLSDGLSPGKGWGLIYADGGANILITGGYFAVIGTANEKVYEYTLNCKDYTDSFITLKGGYFFECDPRAHDAITYRPYYPEVIVDWEYKVEKLENATFKGHNGTWYHVIEKTEEEKAEYANNVLWGWAQLENLENVNDLTADEIKRSLLHTLDYVDGEAIEPMTIVKNAQSQPAMSVILGVPESNVEMVAKNGEEDITFNSKEDLVEINGINYKVYAVKTVSKDAASSFGTDETVTFNKK